MKKKVPLTILEMLTGIIEEYRPLIKVVDKDDCLLQIVESDNNSDFYFKLTSTELRNGKLLYFIDYRPTDKNNVTSWKGAITPDIFEPSFRNWFQLIIAYNQPHPLFNDPIIESYFNELETDFEIVDEDANTAPYKYKEQEQIFNIYDSIIKLILEEKNEDNKEEAEEIISEIEIAKKQLPKSTKRQAIYSLRKIVAFCKKYSYNVAKAISAEILVEIGKKLLIGG